MTAKNPASLQPSELSDDSSALLDAEWDEWTLPSEAPKAVSLDAELATSSLHLAGLGSEVPSKVLNVDSGRVMPTLIHNAFFVAGKVPSLNELLDAKGGSVPTVRSIIMRRFPSKGKKSAARFDLYNELKQDWTHRTIKALPAGFNTVESAYFGYVVIESDLRRDPSNFCSAAVKFIEDGLVRGGVIRNDGWGQVLGIRFHWLKRVGRPEGVFVVMSSTPLPEAALASAYEDWFLAGLIVETVDGQQ